jgi:hypothetical protein
MKRAPPLLRRMARIRARDRPVEPLPSGARGRIVTMIGKSVGVKACDLDRLAAARHG